MMTAFDLSVGLFVRGLAQLKVLLAKCETHSPPPGEAGVSLLSAQLAEGMHDLAAQVHWAGEGAKLAVERLLGGVPVPLAEPGKTLAELHQRIDLVTAFLSSVDPASLEAGLERTIEISHRGRTKSFRGDRFLREFAIPTFYFHFAMAYAILRQRGVPLQKGDFLGE